MLKPKLKICFGCGFEKRIWKQHEGHRYCQSCWDIIELTSISRGNTFLQKPIPKESPKREKEHKLYTIMRIQFLKDHPMCQMHITGICQITANEIQHLKGRGKYYIDMSTWMAACSMCHRYATDHPQEAIDNGWALPRISN